jgi:hypothetical protein
LFNGVQQFCEGTNLSAAFSLPAWFNKDNQVKIVFFGHAFVKLLL